MARASQTIRSDVRDDRSNWTCAMATVVMALLVRDLISIGETLGVDVAERIYYQLAQEPRDAQGDRIDWTAIRAVIVARRSTD